MNIVESLSRPSIYALFSKHPNLPTPGENSAVANVDIIALYGFDCHSYVRPLPDEFHTIRRCVPPATLQMMVVALVHSRLDYGNGVVVGLPAYLTRQLPSVLNAAVRLIFHLKSSDHITDALISLHWLRVRERIQYKLAVMAYKVLHGSAPSYLGPLVRVADVSGRRALRSAGTNRILVPSVTSTTVGSRAFPVAGPLIIIWNSLPDDVISAESLPTFQRKLKRHQILLIVSWLWLLTLTPAVDLAVTVPLRPL